MDIRIEPRELFGNIRAIPSKSQAHRALICAALAEGKTHIQCESESDDIAATVDCLTALGAKIMRNSDGYLVERGIARTTQMASPSLPCAESGSTFRFLLAITGALGRSASFMPKGRLPQRPLSPLYEELAKHGCNLSPQGTVPFNISGQLTPGRYMLDAGVSSQFISGLLFALPLLDKDSELHLTGRAESFSYVEMTLSTLEAFNILIKRSENAFYIPGKQKYVSPGHIEVEGDWSNAAVWLCAGALSSKGVTCENLNPRSRQGDRAVTEILSRFGADIKISDSSVAVSRGDLHGIEIDAGDIPDLVPVLAVVAAAAEGTTVVHNAQRLRAKESNRLEAITATLRALGGDACETDDGLTTNGDPALSGCQTINGSPALLGGAASSFGDHRIVMAAALAASICTSPIIISGTEAVNKSYPGFFNDYQSLGGQLQWEIPN